MFKKGDLVRLVADKAGHCRLGELAVVWDANPYPNWKRGCFIFQHGDEFRWAYYSDAVFESSLSLEQMLKECLE